MGRVGEGGDVEERVETWTERGWRRGGWRGRVETCRRGEGGWRREGEGGDMEERMET